MLEEKIVTALKGLNNGLLKPKKTINFDVVADILNNILNDVYNKDKYFLNEKYEQSNDIVKNNISNDSEISLCCSLTGKTAERYCLPISGPWRLSWVKLCVSKNSFANCS